LLTTYFASWQNFFTGKINLMDTSFDLIVIVVHILFFYLLALVSFNKKDILD